jgi:hypothetical protein
MRVVELPRDRSACLASTRSPQHADLSSHNPVGREGGSTASLERLAEFFQQQSLTATPLPARVVQSSAACGVAGDFDGGPRSAGFRRDTVCGRFSRGGRLGMSPRRQADRAIVQRRLSGEPLSRKAAGRTKRSRSS